MEALRLKDIAALLKVSIPTIHRWRSSGYLPAPSKVGSIPIWDRAEIEQWIRSQREARP